MGLTIDQLNERDNSLDRLQITTFRELCDLEDHEGYVFISYKSDNWKEVFEGKVFELQQKGLRIYSDKKFNDTNQSWLDDLQKNMKMASAIMIFISKEYLLSYATLIELIVAIDNGKPVIPVYLNESKEELFASLLNRADLLVENVKIKEGSDETDVLIHLLNNTTSDDYYAKEIVPIKKDLALKIRRQNLTKSDIVYAFFCIFKKMAMKDNILNIKIDSLVETIKSATATIDRCNVFIRNLAENQLSDDSAAKLHEVQETMGENTDSNFEYDLKPQKVLDQVSRNNTKTKLLDYIIEKLENRYAIDNQETKYVFKIDRIDVFYVIKNECEFYANIHKICWRDRSVSIFECMVKALREEYLCLQQLFGEENNKTASFDKHLRREFDKTGLVKYNGCEFVHPRIPIVSTKMADIFVDAMLKIADQLREDIDKQGIL